MDLMYLMSADLSFFKEGVNVLKVIIMLIGGGFGLMGIVNFLEGYGSDNPGSKSQGIKQLMAGVGLFLLAFLLVPKLAELFNVG